MAWTFNRNEIIDYALRMCNRVSDSNNASQSDINRGADAINMAIEDLYNEGLSLLQIEEDSISTSSKSNTLDADIEDILKVWVQTSSSNDEPFMFFLNRNEYYGKPDKETSGTPYECFIEYSNPRKLILYPVPSTATTVKFLKVVKISSLDTGSSTLDFEKRYYGALTYKTAEILSDIFNLPLQERAWLRKRAEEKIKKARGKEVRNQTRNNIIGVY